MDCAISAVHFFIHTQSVLISSFTAGMTAQVLTDSQSLVKRLAAGPIAQRHRIESEIWNEIELLWREAKCQMVVRWCPAHVGIVGNELADVCQAAGLPDAEESTEHLLTCPARASDRLLTLGEYWEDPKVLSRKPHLVIKFLERIGKIEQT
eukprot:gene38386-21940_t